MFIILKQLETALRAMKNYIDKIVPKKVSDLQNDAEYITETEVPTPDWTATSSELGYIDNKPNILPGTGQGSIRTNAGHTVTGTQSASFGAQNNVSGNLSFSVGVQNNISGGEAFAAGNHNIANHESQFVFGQFNAADPSNTEATQRGTYVEIVGNGTSIFGGEVVRSNARTLDWEGNQWIAGNMKIGGTGYDDSNAVEVATKNDIVTPDWLAAEGEDGYILNKVPLVKGSGENSVQGLNAEANGEASTASGIETIASGDYSLAEGQRSKAVGNGSHAEGVESSYQAKITGDANSTVYTLSKAISDTYNLQAIEEGRSRIAYNGLLFNIIGISDDHTKITVDKTLSENKAINNESCFINRSSLAIGFGSHAEGSSMSRGAASHAEGLGSMSLGGASHAEGNGTTASSKYSHAEGNSTTASGNSSHAEGSFTTAFGSSSHAEGTYTKAYAAAHAEGGFSEANGYYSHAEGTYTVAKHRSQHASGEYNIEDPSTEAAIARGTYIEIVGNGTDINNRSNARTLDWSGNEWLSGTLKVGGTGYTDSNAKEVATKDYVDTSIANIDVSGSKIISGTWTTPQSGQPYLDYDDSAMSDSALIELLNNGESVTLEVNFPDVNSQTDTRYFYLKGKTTAEEGGYSIEAFMFWSMPSVSEFGGTNYVSVLVFIHQYNSSINTYMWNYDEMPFPTNPVEDVQVNGIGVVNQDGIAEIPAAHNGAFGVIQAIDSYGLQTTNGSIAIVKSEVIDCQNANNSFKPIVPSVQHASTFYGLAKAAGDYTQASSNNAVGTYTNDAKSAIRTMLGAGSVDDVQVNGTSVISNGVAAIPIAASGNLGVVKVGSAGGLYVNPNNGVLQTSAANNTLIKTGTDGFAPIVPSHQHEATFYGLAKAAGDTTQSASNNAVGIYTDNAKASIKAMLGVTDPESEIDDTAGSGDVDKTWSADKITSELAGAGSVQDITVNGTSVVGQDGVAEIPVASNNNAGVVKIDYPYGIGLIDASSGLIGISAASSAETKAGSNGRKPITPTRQHESTFYGLAKAAGDTTQSASSNPVGTYTDTAKTKIKQMLGIGQIVHGIKGTWNPNGSDDSKFVFNDPSMTNELLYALLANNTDDVFVLNTNFPNVSGQDTVNSSYQHYYLVDKRTLTYTNSDTVAVTYIFYSDVSILEDGRYAMSTNSYISFTRTSYQSRNSYYWNHGSNRFDVTVNGTSVVNNGVAEIPVASASVAGVVLTDSGYGITINDSGKLNIDPANLALIKSPSGISAARKPIVPSNQHQSVFYGLAKAAGDTTQSASSNPVGTYTDNAKASIKAMLGVGGETQKVTVSGTAPTIVANQNTRYVCGEVVSLDFTPSAEGICDVIFTSGSTVTVLTIPNTVIFPEWFDPTTLEANKTYEISISDGVYGAVMVW